MAKKDNKPDNVIAENRKATFNYAIEDVVEAGVMLLGTEVKALREGKGNIGDSYAVFKDGELWLLNANIAEYSHGNRQNHEPLRTRKLLLHKREIFRLARAREQEGYSLIPLRLYWSKGKIKLALAVAKGKKTHDKRATLRDRDWNRQKQRLLRK